MPKCSPGIHYPPADEGIGHPKCRVSPLHPPPHHRCVDFKSLRFREHACGARDMRDRQTRLRLRSDIDRHPRSRDSRSRWLIINPRQRVGDDANAKQRRDVASPAKFARVGHSAHSTPGVASRDRGEGGGRQGVGFAYCSDNDDRSEGTPGGLPVNYRAACNYRACESRGPV